MQQNTSWKSKAAKAEKTARDIFKLGKINENLPTKGIQEKNWKKEQNF